MNKLFLVAILVVLGTNQSAGQCISHSYRRLESQGNFWAFGYVGQLYSVTFEVNTGTVFSFKWTVTPQGGTPVNGPVHGILLCASGSTTSADGYTSTCSSVGSSITANLSTTIARNNNLTFDITASATACGINIPYYVVYCGNVVGDGLVQSVPANMGYQSSFTFSCLTDYSVQNSVSQCQANAMWSPLPSCIAVCNTSSIPENSTYKLPSIPEQHMVNSTLKLNCTDGHNGSALATCVNVSTWNIENNCSAVCYLNATYCDPSGARSVLEGVHSLICCNDRSSVKANCNSSGSISYSKSCISGGLKWWEILLIVIFAGICPLFAVLVILWLIYDKEENRTGEGLLTFYFKCRFYERIPWCSPCSCCKSN